MERVLRKLLPLANPDFDRSYALVRKWWVEVDETGTPQRELGFDAHGSVIVAGPLGNNFGFWTDSAMTFDPAEYKVIPDDEFSSAWSLFQARWVANAASKTSFEP